MATDLSIKFQENFSSAVETGLSKEITVNEAFKTNAQNLSHKPILQVKSNFAYGQNNLEIIYLIDLPLASLILHSMMFEEYALEEELNDDIVDACKEFISQVSGAIETSINGEEYEDINNIKFTIGEVSNFNQNEYQSENPIFRINSTIDTNSFDLYLEIKESDQQYFETFFNSKEDENIQQNETPEVLENEVEATDDDEITLIPDDLPEGLADALEEHHEEEETSDNDTTEDKTPEQANLEEVQEETEVTKEDSNTKEESSEAKNEVDEPKDTEDKKEEESENNENDEDTENKKDKKLKLIIIILGALISIIIIAIVVMYFMGVFDEPQMTEENNVTKKQPTKQELIIAEIKNKHIEFVPSMIDEKRVNKKLSLLTKYEILEEDVITRFQQNEKERLYQIKMQRLEEFAKNNKEESLFKSTLINRKDDGNLTNVTQNITNDINNTNTQTYLDPNEKLIFIQVDPIEYKNFKEIIKNEKTSTTSISMCKNNFGKIYIYVGPMYINLETNNIMKNIRTDYPNKSSSIKLIELQRFEFNKLCNF
jgi:flagellar basal body-associated protein FliL